MKAVVQDRYGSADDLAVRDIEAPKVGPGDVLVRVRAASLHPDVWHVVAGRPFVLRLMGAGLRRPRNPVPGTDVAGVVEAVGSTVTRFRPGDAVLGEVVRGFQWMNGGAFAELVSAPEDAFVAKPARLTFEQAAAAPTSGLLAVQVVRDEAGVRAGHHVVINGAGGSVGTFAVQIAKGLGATVTAVDLPHKLDTLRSIGADHVVDCTREDFTRGEIRYDVIVDIASTLAPRDVLRALTPDGRYVLVGHDHYGSAAGSWLGSIPRMVGLMVRSAFDTRFPRPSWPAPFADRLDALARLLEDGTVTPVVDRVFDLAEIREAMRYLQSGQATGKIVVRVSEAGAGGTGARD